MKYSFQSLLGAPCRVPLVSRFAAPIICAVPTSPLALWRYAGVSYVCEVIGWLQCSETSAGCEASEGKGCCADKRVIVVFVGPYSVISLILVPSFAYRF